MVRILLAKAAVAAVEIQDAGVVAMMRNGEKADLAAEKKMININVAIDPWLYQERSITSNERESKACFQIQSESRMN